MLSLQKKCELGLEEYDKVSEPIVAPYSDSAGYTIPPGGLLDMLSSIRIEDINKDVFSYRFLEKFTYL